MQAKVLGWKWFTGNIDQKDIDSGRVFVELPLNEASGREKGTTAAEMRLPNADAIKRIAHLPLPGNFELETEMVADGKNGFRTVVLDIRPIDSDGVIARPPTPAAAPAAVSQAKRAA